MKESHKNEHQEVSLEESLTRRTFLVYALMTSGTLGFAGLVSPILRFAYPVAAATAGLRQRVARTSEIGADVRALDFEYQDVPCSLIVQEDGTLMGLSRVCTHLGCIVSWRSSDEVLYCPCHAGVFSPTGEVLSGPPPRPLPRLAISVEDTEIWAEGWLPG